MTAEHIEQALRDASHGWRDLGAQVAEIVRTLDQEVRSARESFWQDTSGEVFDEEWAALMRSVEAALPVFEAASGDLRTVAAQQFTGASVGEGSVEGGRPAAPEAAALSATGGDLAGSDLAGGDPGGGATGGAPVAAELGGGAEPAAPAGSGGCGPAPGSGTDPVAGVPGGIAEGATGSRTLLEQRLGEEVSRGAAPERDRDAGPDAGNSSGELGGSAAGATPGGGTGPAGAAPGGGAPVSGGAGDGGGEPTAQPMGRAAMPAGMQVGYVMAGLGQLGMALGSTFGGGNGGGAGGASLSRHAGYDASAAPRGAGPFGAPPPPVREVPSGGLGIAGGVRTPARQPEEPSEGGRRPDSTQHGAFG